MLNELRTKKRGFTLLELIVVIVVLGVIAGLAVPTFLSVTTKSREQVAVNEANAFARDVKALAAFTTGADASAWTAEADGETAGSYANGTYTASNGCTVAVTTSGDDVTVGAVSCDGAAAPTTTVPATPIDGLSLVQTLEAGAFSRVYSAGVAQLMGVDVNMGTNAGFAAYLDGLAAMTTKPVGVIELSDGTKIYVKLDSATIVLDTASVDIYDVYFAWDNGLTGPEAVQFEADFPGGTEAVSLKIYA